MLPYQRGRRRDLAQAELVRVDEDIQALIPGIEHASRHVKQAREALDVARQREQQLTGSGVDQLRLRIDAAREDVDRTAKRWQNLSTQLAKVGINHAPETAAEFAELLAQLDQRANGSLPAGASYVQQQLLADAKRNLAQVGAEIETLRRSGTSVPAALLEIRAQIERAIGASPGALPFTAELIEVRQEYAEWTGAIERVLRSIALTMLVPEHHLAEVRRWVNAHRIPGRLRFEVVGEPPHRSPLLATCRSSTASLSPSIHMLRGLPACSLRGSTTPVSTARMISIAMRAQSPRRASSSNRRPVTRKTTGTTFPTSGIGFSATAKPNMKH